MVSGNGFRLDYESTYRLYFPSEKDIPLEEVADEAKKLLEEAGFDLEYIRMNPESQMGMYDILVIRLVSDDDVEKFMRVMKEKVYPHIERKFS